MFAGKCKEKSPNLVVIDSTVLKLHYFKVEAVLKSLLPIWIGLIIVMFSSQRLLLSLTVKFFTLTF